MKNRGLIISSVAIVLSFVSIGLVIIRTTPFTFDNMEFYGWVIAILSLLVTILIGWQIYNVMYIDAKIKDSLKSAIDNQYKIIDKRTKSAKDEAIGTSLYNVGQAMFYNGFYDLAMDNYIKAIGAISDSEMEKKEAHVDLCFSKIILTIKKIKEQSDEYSVSEKALASYINLLLPLNDERILDIIEFLRGVKKRKT